MEIEAAQRLIEQARRAGVQKLIFVSSVMAKPDGPNRNSRVKWAIEQKFLSVSGTIIRLGLVYGGSTDNNQGLFAFLDKLVKASPLLPAFLPPLWIQPIHIDDLCETILNVLKNPENIAHVYEATAEGIHLTAFLRRLAWHRHHRYPAVFPFPVSLISCAAAVGARAAPLISTYYVELLKGLRTLRKRPTGRSAPGREYDLAPTSRRPVRFAETRVAGRGTGPRTLSQWTEPRLLDLEPVRAGAGTDEAELKT